MQKRLPCQHTACEAAANYHCPWQRGRHTKTKAQYRKILPSAGAIASATGAQPQNKTRINTRYKYTDCISQFAVPPLHGLAAMPLRLTTKEPPMKAHSRGSRGTFPMRGRWLMPTMRFTICRGAAAWSSHQRADPAAIVSAQYTKAKLPRNLQFLQPLNLDSRSDSFTPCACRLAHVSARAGRRSPWRRCVA